MYYKINGKLMPGDITSFEPESNHLYGENTGRDEAGYNHLDLVRADVRKWSIKHEMLTRGELDRLKKACNPLGFDFEGLSSAGYVTAFCYANITGESCRYYEDDTPDGSRWDCNVSIVEN